MATDDGSRSVQYPLPSDTKADDVPHAMAVPALEEPEPLRLM